MVDVEAVDVQSPEWSSDINVVSGALKLWFRELPEPVLTFGLKLPVSNLRYSFKRC